jgi:hypothetical protein
MAEGVELDQNDQALMRSFLRGMRRFQKHVESQSLDALKDRMYAAYRAALEAFSTPKKGGKK